MNDRFDRLLDRYDRGEITRRDLLVGLTTLVVSGRSASAAEPAIGTVKQLNHVTAFVRDVQKSVAFYHDLFGMPLLTRQGNGMNLNAGTGFLGLYPAQTRPPAIDHVCLALEGFDADAALKRLEGRGVKANIRLRGDTKELYLTDPDGLRVQLQDVRYKGGVGPLGDRDPV